MAVRVDLNISLDSFATTTDKTPEVPFGVHWSRLVGAYAATRTFRARVPKAGLGPPASMTITLKNTSLMWVPRSWALACSDSTTSPTI